MQKHFWTFFFFFLVMYKLFHDFVTNLHWSIIRRLNNNKLIGSIPRELTGLTNLQILWVSFNLRECEGDNPNSIFSVFFLLICVWFIIYELILTFNFAVMFLIMTFVEQYQLMATLDPSQLKGTTKIKYLLSLIPTRLCDHI